MPFARQFLPPRQNLPPERPGQVAEEGRNPAAWGVACGLLERKRRTPYPGRPWPKPGLKCLGDRQGTVNMVVSTMCVRSTHLF